MEDLRSLSAKLGGPKEEEKIPNRVGIGLLGLGTHSQRSHLDPLLKVLGNESKLVAAWDPNHELLNSIATKTGMTPSGSEEALWQNPLVEAVIVCSPDRFHMGALRSAVKNNKHALIEKPMAVAGQELVELTGLLQTAAEKKLG